jgi:hypothetical protein
MELDEEKIDEVVLALLYLTRFSDGPNTRSWKSYDWSILDRLHEKGYITNPKSKSKSVVLFESAEAQGEKLIGKYFAAAQ